MFWYSPSPAVISRGGNEHTPQYLYGVIGRALRRYCGAGAGEGPLYIYIDRHYFYYGTPPLPPGARRHTPPPLLAAPLTADSQACADCQRVATNVADSLAFSLQKRIVGAIMASPT
jgi:hypothetical protein